MEATRTSLRRSVALIRRSPLLVGATLLALSLCGVTLAVVSLVPPAVAVVGQAVLGTFAAGVLGMVSAAARDGQRPSLLSYGRTLFADAPRVLGALLLRRVLLLGTLAVLFVLSAFVWSGLLGLETVAVDSPAAVGTAVGASVAAALGVVVTVAIALAFWLVFQFVDVAIVVGDSGVLAAFGESWRLFEEDPLSVLGYSLVRSLLLLCVGLFVVVPAALGLVVVPDLWFVPAAAVGTVLVPPAMALNYVYHAQYYVHRRPDSLGTTAGQGYGDDRDHVPTSKTAHSIGTGDRYRR